MLAWLQLPDIEIGLRWYGTLLGIRLDIMGVPVLPRLSTLVDYDVQVFFTILRRGYKLLWDIAQAERPIIVICHITRYLSKNLRDPGCSNLNRAYTSGSSEANLFSSNFTLPLAAFHVASI